MNDLKKIAAEMRAMAEQGYASCEEWADQLDALAAQAGEPVAWKYGPEATRWYNAETTQPEPKTVAAWGIEYAYAAPPPSPVSMAEPKALFCPTRLPPPDEYGFFSHPDIHAIFGDDECDQDETAARLLSLGWEANYVSGDYLVDEDTLEYNLVGWRPEPPKGDGWRNVSVFDTEDGPYAIFVRPKIVSTAEFEKALDGYAANYHDRFADPAADRAEVLRLASQGVRPSVSRESLALELVDNGVDACHTDSVIYALLNLGIEVKP